MRHHSHLILRTSLVAVCVMVWAGTASAAITYSGLVDIPITTSFAGVYLDVATQGTTEPINDPDGVATDSYTIGYSQPATWDVNFFFGGIGIAYSDTFQPFVDDPVSNRSQILNVAQGTVISVEEASRTLGLNAYGGSGRSNGGVGSSHFDTPTINNSTYSAFTPGAKGYISFVLDPGASEQFGWMSVTLQNDGSVGTIHEWAYSDEVGFQVGQVPEPKATLLLLFGLTGLLLRRRSETC